MPAQRVFRDPVHTTISFEMKSPAERLALALIDAPEVQRLRHIRQLGLASFVYHGVEHSRFSHSLGVAHLARRLYKAATVDENHSEEEYALVLAAAVLHDVGHAPFSHALEKSLGVDHEDLSVAVLNEDTGVRHALLTFGGESFLTVLGQHFTDACDRRTASLISSQLDADRMDYILRDGYFAGVPNAHYDLERIIQKTSIDEKGLIFDARAQQAIEGCIMARYHLYLQLYYHRTVRGAEALLRATIERARDLVKEGESLGQIGPVAALFDTSPSPLDALMLTDHELWAAFRLWAKEHKDRILKDLAGRLIDRRLFKTRDIKGEAMFSFAEGILPELQEVARKANFDPRYYLRTDSAKDSPYKLSDPAAGTRSKSTRLRHADGRVTSLELVSGVIKALQQEAYQINRICFPTELRDHVTRAIS